MSTFADYVTYFENIAKNHVSIRHDLTNKHFARFELEEALSGMKARVRFPAILLESYEYTMEDLLSDNPMKLRTGAIMVLDKPKRQGDYDENITIMDTAEQIMDDIIRLIYFHKSEFDHELARDIDLNTCEVLPITNGPDGSYGFRLSFQIKSGDDMTLDTDKWVTTEF